jgi:hypothetical protein
MRIYTLSIVLFLLYEASSEDKISQSRYRSFATPYLEISAPGILTLILSEAMHSFHILRYSRLHMKECGLAPQIPCETRLLPVTLLREHVLSRRGCLLQPALRDLFAPSNSSNIKGHDREITAANNENAWL